MLKQVYDIVKFFLPLDGGYLSMPAALAGVNKPARATVRKKLAGADKRPGRKQCGNRAPDRPQTTGEG
jgi:hypothetical protein